LHQHQQDGVKSPHKPLLALLAVARLLNSGSSSTPYSVAEAVLAPLLTELGAAPGTSIAYPFTRLRSDDIWELNDAVPMDRVEPLRSGDVTGRLVPGIEAKLRSDPWLARQVARDLAVSVVAPRDALERIGLDPDVILEPDLRRRVAVELDDYVHVTLPAARAQFRELLRRRPIVTGRQPRFLIRVKGPPHGRLGPKWPPAGEHLLFLGFEP
jgi:hypothetical protein